MWFSFKRYEFKIVWSPHVIFKHRVISANQNNFNLQDWLSLILHVGVWSKYFVKIPFWKKYLLISKQQEDKEKTCFVQGWDVIPKQNAKWQKSITKMLDSLTPSWISFSGNIYVLPSNSDQHVILKMFGGQHDWWHHLSQTQLNSWNSCVCSTEMVQEPSMIFTSGLSYTTVVACSLSKSGTLSLESGRCW